MGLRISAVAAADWMTELLAAIRSAIDSGEPAIITVPTEARKELGERAVARMSPGAPVTFEVAATDAPDRASW